MPLIDLLKNESNFLVGTTTDSFGNPYGMDENGAPIVFKNVNIERGGPSKTIKYGLRTGENPYPSTTLDRVEWYGSDSGPSGTDPTFLNGSTDHKSGNVDYIFRGGNTTFFDRRSQDTIRINNFLFGSNSIKGQQFLLRQGALQLLNPQVNTRTYNAGISLLASIAAAGVTSFKRSGLIPEPADTNFGSSIGNTLGSAVGGVVGNFISNAFGGGYLDLLDKTTKGNPKNLENEYGLGSPGASTPKKGLEKIIDITFGGNPFAKKETYNVSLKDSIDSNQIDRINYQKIFNAPNGSIPTGDNYFTKDLCPFRFEVVDSDKPVDTNYIVFRAYLDALSDNFNAAHNEIKYNGRGEHFYTYNSFKRNISLGFKIAAQSRHEMKPLYQKLNYLAAQTAPNYSPSMGRIRTPYMKLTVGDYFSRVPGLLNTVGITWQKDYPWEIKYDAEDKDSEM